MILAPRYFFKLLLLALLVVLAEAKKADSDAEFSICEAQLNQLRENFRTTLSDESAARTTEALLEKEIASAKARKCPPKSECDKYEATAKQLESAVDASQAAVVLLKAKIATTEEEVQQLELEHEIATSELTRNSEQLASTQEALADAQGQSQVRSELLKAQESRASQLKAELKKLERQQVDLLRGIERANNATLFELIEDVVGQFFQEFIEPSMSRLLAPISNWLHPLLEANGIPVLPEHVSVMSAFIIGVVISLSLYVIRRLRAA